MVKSFLAYEAKRSIMGMRKLIIICWAVCIAALSILYFTTVADGGDIGLLQPFIIGFPVVLAFFTIILFVRTTVDNRGIKDYGNLIVHDDMAPREVVGRIVDDEADRGMILVSEYLDTKPKGAKIVLLPSYLLICDQKVTAIPVDKIFWVCAQVGYRGGPFIVRIKIFAERKIYDVDCAFIDHTKDIVDKIYFHIPNIFSEYDVFDLSYRLEEAFNKNYSQFLEFYRQHKFEFNGA